jgi:tetratricopeptide (TPR) repeat protein
MARNEIIKLNNDGVKLVKEGNLSKAIDFFEQAADNLPANKIINANAAHALLLYMQKSGSKPLYLRKAMRFLDRVKNIDPAYKDLESMMKMYNELNREV